MYSALRRAVEKGNLKAVMIALDHGADIEEADIHGDPGLPLRIACFKGHIDVVRELIRRGADIHAPNAQGRGGPIRMALRGEHRAVVNLLLAHGAEMPEALPQPKAAITERRKRRDRRMRNAGPPKGLSERRLYEERRVTSVTEVELSEKQWETYFSASMPSIPFPTLHDPADLASRVFERARD